MYFVINFDYVGILWGLSKSLKKIDFLNWGLINSVDSHTWIGIHDLCITFLVILGSFSVKLSSFGYVLSGSLRRLFVDFYERSLSPQKRLM